MESPDMVRKSNKKADTMDMHQLRLKLDMANLDMVRSKKVVMEDRNLLSNANPEKFSTTIAIFASVIYWELTLFVQRKRAQNGVQVRFLLTNKL